MSGMIESVTIILELLAILLCLSNLYEKRIKLDFYSLLLAVIKFNMNGKRYFYNNWD